MDRVVTDLAVLDLEAGTLRVVELAPGELDQESIDGHLAEILSRGLAGDLRGADLRCISPRR